MTLAVLLVDEDDRRRREVYAELSARRVPVLEETDAFDAMATLGRVELGALVLGKDRRRHALRGLCHLARRRYPTIRLVVLASAAVEPHTVRATLGLPVDVLDADGPPGGIAAQVLSLMARPLDPFAEQPTTEEVDRAIADAFAEAAQERSAHDAAEAEAPRSEAPALVASEHPSPRVSNEPPLEPRLEGVLDERSGAVLLMEIFSRALTGRLEVAGVTGTGTLYFYRGEPVAADHAGGDAGLLAELEERDLVPDGLDIRFVPEGELLATLVAAGNVSGEAMHRFVGTFVKKRLHELVLQREGSYRFLDDRRFLDNAPLVRVNPFGAVPELGAPERPGASGPPTPCAPGDESASPTDDEDAALREEILNLYMRLKPVSHPRQVLGLPVWADKADVDAAYQRRMQELDPRRVPDGPSREMLVARIEELRAKVIRAMETIQFQQGARAGSPLPSLQRSSDDSNPF